MHRSVWILACGAAALAILFADCTSARAEQPPQSNCYGDDDCFSPSAPYCDLMTGNCEACLIDEHCEVDELCHQHNCVPKCFSDADCAAPEGYCSAEGVCVECVEDSHCPGDAPLCLIEAGVGECVECIVDEDCSGDTPWCKWNNTCVQCLEHSDCPAEQFCSSQSTCELDLCEPGALSCTDNGIWVLQCDESGSRANAVEECPNADCEDGVCGTPAGTGSEGASAEGTDSETSGGPGDTTADGGDPGATPGGRGCSCDVDGDRNATPLGGLGVLVLLGLWRRRDGLA